MLGQATDHRFPVERHAPGSLARNLPLVCFLHSNSDKLYRKRRPRFDYKCSRFQCNESAVKKAENAEK
jgi:hypothetical protein